MNSTEPIEQSPPLFGVRIAAGFSAQFLFIGLFLPFFPVWLLSNGLSPAEISTVLSISLVMRVVTSAQVLSFADKVPDRARLLSLLSIFAAFAILGFVWTDRFVPILLVAVIFHLFFNPLLPLLDAIAMSGVRRFDADYGRMRIAGSVAFILANLGGGTILAGYSPQAIIWCLIASASLTAAVSFLVPRIGRRQSVETTNVESKPARLFRNREFVALLIAGGLGQASHAMLYGFGSIYWQSLGYSGLMIGSLWAIGVIAEIILFHFGKPVLNRLAAPALLFAGLIGGVIRWVFFPAIEDFEIFVFWQILHAFSFGAVHLAIMHVIADAVPESRLGAAQGLNFVVAGALMGVLVFLSGPLYAALGGDAFLLMASVAMLAILFVAIAWRLSPKKGGWHENR